MQSKPPKAEEPEDNDDEPQKKAGRRPRMTDATSEIPKGYFSDYKEHPGTALRPDLFWEYDLNDFDYQVMIRLVVQRVVERGGISDFYAMLNLYGQNRVVETIKILPYLGEKNMTFASNIFNIPLESLLCYKNMSSRQRCWNY